MTAPIARTVAALGLLYPLLNLVGFAAFPKPPGGDVSAAHDPQWLSGHINAVIAQSYVRAFAALGFIALSVAVAHAAGRSKILIASGGVTCGAVLLAAQASTLAAAFAAHDHLAAASIRPLDSVNAALLSLSSLPAVLLFAAAGALFWQRRTVPRWLAGLTLAGAPLALLDAVGYDGGPLGGISILSLAFFLLWSLATAAYLTARPTNPDQGRRGAAFPPREIHPAAG